MTVTPHHLTEPSASRFTPTTSVASASAGKTTVHHATWRNAARAGDREPPVGRRRLEAEAEERERRDGEDRVPESDRRLDEDRPRDVRQDLGGHDVRPRSPRSRAADMYSRSRSTSTAERTVRPTSGMKMNAITRITFGVAAERREHEDGDDDEREREHRIDEPAHDVVDEPAVVAGHEPTIMPPVTPRRVASGATVRTGDAPRARARRCRGRRCRCRTSGSRRGPLASPTR